MALNDLSSYATHELDDVSNPLEVESAWLVDEYFPALDKYISRRIQSKNIEIMDGITGRIETPEEQTYTLMEEAPYSGYFTKVGAINAAGSCSIRVLKNVSDASDPVSVTTSYASTTTFPIATFAKGDRVLLDVSAITSSEDLDFHVNYVRNIIE